MRHSQKERHSFLIRKIEGSNPSISGVIKHFSVEITLCKVPPLQRVFSTGKSPVEAHFFYKNKRAYSLRVEHAAHNGRNVGSNPAKPKKFYN